MESLFFPLLLALLAGFMFLSIRKQKKRMTEMQDMQNSVATGARVQLTAGMYATVVESTPDFVDLEIATGVVTRFSRQAIVRVVPTDEAAETYPGALSTRPEALDEDADARQIDNPGTESRTDDSYSADRPGEGTTDDK
ncbi:preprotein translocase subunit YajC [Gordonia sp. Z-3]|jgi:preprotein translocase subunit YajC|uniref:Preprotein translocase subunit YajC n=1 Tax=Gordonia aquimaris TaxID=2984863 RepID=A0A9X3D5D3_9ACTN|nr:MULTISPECIES: preprotein translocase subunit YajC [Gordonia]MAU81916.1 preprotein translocase subunit YajC [Gordonia sp. (in: high G+C Gram-positive bacteria)]MCX2965065.1 preprotein translocase subunit YajC [Gordonia aquimaris]MED5800280.1 preprotein translocase subunit YajC [Gordonia sp. Z-3]